MLNSMLAIGRLGQDARLIATRNGRDMAAFSIAVEKDLPEAKRKELGPDWLSCVIFGDRAKSLSPWLTKGKLIGISGRLESYKDPKTGFTMMRITVNEVNFLSSSPDKDGVRPVSREAEPVEQPTEEMDLESMPF